MGNILDVMAATFSVHNCAQHLVTALMRKNGLVEARL